MLSATDGAIRKAYLDSRYGQLHYRYVAPPEALRTGRPIVIFGSNPCSGVAAHELLAELGTDRVALAFDTPGYGQSARPAAPLRSVLDFAEVFAQGLRDLGIARADAMGDHSGAMLALALAACAPDIMARVVVSAVPYLVDKTLRAQRAARWPEITDPEQIPPQEQAKFRTYVLARLEKGLPLWRAMELYLDAISAGVYSNWLVLAAYAPDTEAWLTSLDTPVLLLKTDDGLAVNNAEVARLIANPSIRERMDLTFADFQLRAGEIAAEVRAYCDAD